MPKKESEFLHPSAGRCKRDPSKVAVRWKTGVPADRRAELLEEAGLERVEFPAPKGEKKARPVLSVNNTAALSWAAPRSGKEVSPDAIDKLEASSDVEWVSGVYRSEKGAEGLEGLFTVNPARVYVSAAAHETMSDLGSLGLSVDSARTGRLHGLVCLTVQDASLKGKKNAIGAAESLAGLLAARPSGRTPGDLRFENIPLVSPACHGGGNGNVATEPCEITGHQVNPNDPLYGVSWGLQKINAPYAWTLSQGNPGVVVAVLDEGVELGHPDLNVHPDSWNASTDMPDGSPTGNHGTACAGIVAANINNAMGAVGVAGKSRIMAIATATWADIDIAEGLYFAADHGAQVVSMSFGVYPWWGFWDFDLIRAALQYAHDKGLVLVAASGNENIPTSRFPGSDARTLCVGGSNRDDERKRVGDTSAEAWWGACYGPDLQVVAPCLEIPTTDRLGGAGYSGTDYYNFFNGTSSATPHVAGLAALLRSIRPDLSNIEVKEIISRTCDKISPALYAYALTGGKPYGTWNAETGYGRINVERALTVACSFGKEKKDGPCDLPELKLAEIPADCIAPPAPRWMPYDQCIYFYEPRFVDAAGAQFQVVYEHCLRLLGRQQGPLLYTTTLLPGEKVTLYHYDRFRRIRAETARVSVHTSYRQAVSGLWQSRRSRTEKTYQDLLVNIRSDDDHTITIGGLLFPIGWEIENPDLDFTHAEGASVQNVSESFSQIAVSASQQVDTERSLVISNYEESETKDITSRTLENKNHCYAVTYFVRRVLEVYQLHTVVRQLAIRKETANRAAGGWQPVHGMGDEDRKRYRGVFDRLPRLGAAFHAPIRITLPTDGALYEAEFAHCSSCEPQREMEVQLMIEKARGEARKVCLEAELMALEVERRKMLLGQGELKPFEVCEEVPVPQP